MDNVALVPASLLPFKARWQAVANDLPRGDILIVLPDSASAARRTLQSIGTILKTKGHQVTTIAAGTLE